MRGLMLTARHFVVPELARRAYGGRKILGVRFWSEILKKIKVFPEVAEAPGFTETIRETPELLFCATF